MPTYTTKDGDKCYLRPDMEHDAEEAECANMYLDELNIPKTIDKKKLSLVGRIMYAIEHR